MMAFVRLGQRSFFRILFPFLALAVFCGVSLSSAALAQQGNVRGKFGEWELRCDVPPGATKEQCGILQSVAAEEKPNLTLTVMVFNMADGKGTMMRIVAPLGVYITMKVRLWVDSADLGRADYTRCMYSGCVADVVLDDALIKQLKTGKTATFVIYETPEEGIGIPLTLTGFKEGFEKLP